jgi:putative CocE/NonD family hydrolase
MKQGEIYEVKIAVPPVSNLFKVGHRIRVDISSSNFPRFDVNPNSGEPMGRHTTVIVARNTVHHDSNHASHIILPIVPQ